MTSIDIADLKELVTEAGRLALRYYGKVSKSLKTDLSIVTEADAAIEEFLKRSLTALAPDFGYIGEDTEQVRTPRPGEDRSWVVDALDGTQAFSARIPNWSPAVCVVIGHGVKAPISQSNIVVCARLNCGAARIQIANSTVAPGLIALRLSIGVGFSANLSLLYFPDEKVRLVYRRRYRDVEKATIISS